MGISSDNAVFQHVDKTTISGDCSCCCADKWRATDDADTSRVRHADQDADCNWSVRIVMAYIHEEELKMNITRMNDICIHLIKNAIIGSIMLICIVFLIDTIYETLLPRPRLY